MVDSDPRSARSAGGPLAAPDATESALALDPPAPAGRPGLIRGPRAESESALALAQHWATVARPVSH